MKNWKYMRDNFELYLKGKEYYLSENVSNFLHFSRWIAAFLVVLSHVRAMSFPPFDQLLEKGIFIKFFYFISSLGHEAVIIFFILSGYLIGGEVMREMKDNCFDWKRYLTKRIVRLYIVLIPALILTAGFDRLGYHFFNQLGSFNRFFETGKESIETFFINLLMLQHSHGAIFGTNDPLWSLAYEFWYYILFPLILQIFFIKSKKIKIISSILILLIISSISWKIVLYFSIWLTGTMIWFVNQNKFFNLKIISYFLLLLFVGSITVSRYLGNYAGDLFVGVVYAVLTIYFIYNTDESSLFRCFLNWKGHKKLADFSYSLYLIHFPFMMLVFNIYYVSLGDIRLNMHATNFFVLFAAIFLIYTFSYIIYVFSERNTKKITLNFLQLLGQK